MNCRKCGNLLNEGDTFCRVCGESVVQNNVGVQPVQNVGVTPVDLPNLNSNVQVQQPVQQPIQQSVQQPIQQPIQQPVQQSVQQSVQVPVQPQPAQPMQQANYGMPNPNMMQGGVQQPKNNNTLFIVVIVLLLLVILGLGGFVGYKVLSKNDTKVEENKDKDRERENNSEEESNDGDDDENQNVVADTNVCDLYGYKFTVPSELKYQEEGETLIFSDSTSFQVNMTVGDYRYSDIVADQTSLVAELTGVGFTVVAKAERQFGNRRFYLFQVELNGQEGIYFFTQIDEYVSTMGTVSARSIEGYEKALEYVGKMTDNVTKSSVFAPGEEKENKAKVNSIKIESTEIKAVQYPLK